MSSKTEDIDNTIDIDVANVVETGTEGMLSQDDDRVVTLSEFKKFLNLEGIDYDDDILQLALDSAIGYCNKVNETEYKRIDCPAEVKYAILGLATHYFESKTGEASQSEDTALKGVHRLLAIARKKITL
ncbi:DNA packaging protein [Brachyspira hyodysenteriae]|uniref:DNA packaging protein n=1 Tax=Brachyspira hyodysenteriae ATCC 27164 TaxID=1266923 RepID=A0A3B6W3P8_BRAHO|nr:head-tail connector protein [Brachyspira hyodysenteriae]ANN64623.1 DNA packaging protein [Brachyspira hyodysenteriae ATCC 27164]KLI22768.1 DNA packaging protein [Brachyspira hyodysenteriae]MCZ9924216.1 head-tail connector protein [Brachyspira hyodysenteriae]